MLRQWWQRRRQLAQPWQQQRYLALDAETSGLDAGHDNLLALGWVTLRPPVIAYGSAHYHVLAESACDLKQSPVIHGLVQRDFQQPEDTATVLRQLQQDLQGAVLLCHHVALDWQFLQRAAQTHAVLLEPLALVDTLQLEARRLQQQQQAILPGDLSLRHCRARYRLPDYSAHHALSDAMACAELFLAQAYQFGGSAKVGLNEFVIK